MPEGRFSVGFLDDESLRGTVAFFTDRADIKFHVMDVYGYYMRSAMGPIKLLKFNLEEHFKKMEASEIRNAKRSNNWSMETVDYCGLKPFATFTEL